MPGLFDIRAATNTVVLGEDCSAEACFTATNLSGRSIRLARADVEVVQGEAATGDWLSLVGEPEREFAIGATEQYIVRIQVPPGSPAGSYTFRLNLVDVDNTDEGFSQGQPVTVAVPGVTLKAPAPTLPWWWIGAAAAALFVVFGALLWAFVFSKTNMPNVIGDPFVSAEARVGGAGLLVGRVQVVESMGTYGEVLYSTPPAGARMGRSSTVDLVVARVPSATPTPTSTNTRTPTPTPGPVHIDRGLDIKDDLAAGGDIDVGGSMVVTGDVTLGTDASAVTIGGRPLFKYLLVRPGQSDTGVSADDYVCGVTGFDAGWGDIQESNAGWVLDVVPYIQDGTWRIHAGLRTHGPPLAWTLWVMCVDRRVATIENETATPHYGSPLPH